MQLQKKIALWILGIALGLAVLYFAVVSPLLSKVNPETPKEPITLLEGEGYYQNGNTVFTDQGVVYPTVSYSNMFRVVVHTAKGEEYLFYHHLSQNRDYFYMGRYEGTSYDEGGSPTFYHPFITENFLGFDYTTLYDGKSKVPAMITAVGNVLFTERVYIKTEGTSYEDYQTALRRYGLAEEDNAPWIEVTPFARDDRGYLLYTAPTEGEAKLYCYNPDNKKYYDTDGVENTEGGYVYDESYLYEGDTSLLTPVSDESGAKRLYVGRDLPSGDGYYVRLAGRDVVYVVGSVKSEMADIDLANLVERDLSYYVEPNLMVLPNTVYDPFYTPHIGMYTGEKKAAGTALAVGDTVYFTKADGTWISHTVTNDPKDILSAVLLSRRAGQKDIPLPTLSLVAALDHANQTTYTVKHIHSVLNAPYTAWTDDLVGEGAQLKVSFATEDGVLREGILSLSGEGLSASQKALFVGQPTGECDISFTVTYTPNLYFSFEEAKQGFLPVTGLMQEGTTVYFSYYETDPEKAVSAAVTLDLGSTDGFVAALSRLLVGKSVNAMTEVIAFAKDGCFFGEETGEISSAVSYAEDLSFSFYYYGTGKRDPYLADSIYQITGPEELKPYTIDSTTGQQVLEVFASLKGKETVAVGLTPAVMEKYGLYARRLEYSLTYNTKVTEDTQGNITNVTQDFRMDYCFYVSQPVDGYRYVASREYDTVVKVEAGMLSFLDWDFLTRYSRSNLLLMYTSDIKQIEFISSFSDAKAHHTFWLSLDPRYKYESMGEASLVERLYVMYVSGEAQTEAPYIADTPVAAKPGVAVEQLSASDYRVTRLIGGTNLDEIFYQNGHTGRDRVDYMGVHYFRRMMTAVYSTRYMGKVSDDLTEAEIATLLATPEARVMEIKVKLLDGRTFSYGFYAYSGQRMLVSLTGYSPAGEKTMESCLFYVNASEVKKMAAFSTRLTLGQPLHEDEEY